MRNRLIFLPFLLSCSLSAQIVEASFFKGDPGQVMLACADRALALKPKKESVLAQAGRAYLVAGNPGRARDLFKPINHPSGETSRWIGQAWLEAGDARQAVAAFSLIAELDHFAKNDMRDGAVLLMDRGLTKESEALMGQAFETAPGDWQNVTAFARACMRSHHPDLAAQWFARAAQANRKDEDLWMEIAQSLADQGAER